ncbi:hypothetical protein KVT40_004241 [Elsinoe batatas]|uniref:Chromo domain-containing protein n=1 Tax=Elsinoe batatas TaxID=2601811 RepID=A0A8K0L572_9PEZI|nr:hypothetical protein KVT40_004241 [Elsinoe batatas]
MPAKRKRNYEASTSKKRLKQDDRIELGEPDVFEVEEILEEDAKRYRIAWAPNSTTGQVYSPTWEKKSNVNQEAIDDWEAKKRQRETTSTTPKRARGRPKKLATDGSAGSTSTQGRAQRRQQESSPATPVPGRSRRVIESSPSLGTQGTNTSARSRRSVAKPQEYQVEDSASPASQYQPAPHRSFEISIPQLRQSQQDQYSYHASSPSFSSSQIITGTAPRPGQSPSAQASGSQPLVDAAAAPDLTQKHSQYQQVNTSASGEETTTSGEATRSDIQEQTGSGSLQVSARSHPDQAASQSYVPPTQTTSKNSSSGLVLDNVSIEVDQIVEDISDGSASSPGDPPRSRGQLEDRSSLSRGIESSPTSSSPIEEPDFRLGVEATRRFQPAEGLATHISETIEERDFAGTVLSASQLPIVVSPETPGIRSFQGTQVSQRPLQRRLPGERHDLRSSIDSAIFSALPNSADLPRVGAQVQPVTAEGRPIPRSPTQEQAASQSLKRDSRRSQASQGATRQSQLGSPFRGSGEHPQSLENYRSASNSDNLEFKTQISYTPPTRPQRAGIGLDLLGLIQSRGVSSRTHSRNNSAGAPVDISSSSLQQPPSQWPETFLSAPPRPDTLSDLPITPTRAMNSRSPRSVPSDTSHKIQELKEAGGPITPAQRSIGMTTRSSANRAGSPALARDARSPSAVPSAEVVPMPTEEENRTSERYLTLVPEKPQDAKRKKKVLPSGIVDEPVVEAQHQLAQTTNSSDDTNMDHSTDISTTNEFLVPIFFLGGQRDMYKQSIGWERTFIDQFLGQSWPENSPMYDKAQMLVSKLHNLESHPDLLNEESFTQAQISSEQKAEWDNSTSTKFRFLHELLVGLVDQNTHIVIDVAQGRLLDVLDNFLTGLHVEHVTVGSGDKLSQNTGLKVSLLPKHVSTNNIPAVDLVIGFEGSITLIEEERKSFRTRADGTVAPLLYLVIPKTVEHVERYLREDPYATMSSSRRLAILIENAGLLRNEAGLRQIHDQDSQNCAVSIVSWLLDGHASSDWPLDGMPDLTLKDPTSESQATTASESTQPVPASTSSKRSLDDTVSPAAKKARVDGPPSSALDMPSTINPSALSLSGVTDSNHALAASEYISDLANLRAEHEATESALRGELSALARRLGEHITALEELQYRHEDMRTELVKTRVERDEAYTKAATATAQSSSRDSIITKVKTERDTYKMQAEEAKAALHSHVVPELAEMEKLKARLEEAEKDKTKLEGRVESARKEAEYVRSLYQDASSRAMDMADEQSEMQKKVADLERRASVAAQQARLASKDSANQTLRKEIRKLRLEVMDRERVLKAKDEEIARLKEKERGRMGTRGGSVPRSPGRLGSPMRLEPPRSSGVGSRAASPRRGSPAAGTLTGKSKLGR